MVFVGYVVAGWTSKPLLAMPPRPLTDIAIEVRNNGIDIVLRWRFEAAD